MVKTPEKILCPHCGQLKDPRHPRLCTQNPSRLVPVREVNPGIIQDPRTEIQEGIESLGTFSSAMGSDGSLELNKDVKLAELESERWANSLSPTQLRAFAARIKRDELLEKTGVAVVHQGNNNGDILSGLANDVEKIMRSSIRTQIAAYQMQKAGLLPAPADGKRRDDDDLSMKQILLLDRMDRINARNDQSGKIHELSREKDRLEIQNQLAVMTEKLSSHKDPGAQMSEILKTYETLKGVLGNRDSPTTGEIANSLITGVIDRISVPILEPLGQALAYRAAGVIPVGSQQPPEGSPEGAAGGAPQMQASPEEMPAPPVDERPDYINSFCPGTPVQKLHGQ